MSSQAPFFTAEELLDFCFQSKSQPNNIMLQLQPTYDGFSSPIQAIYPQRKIALTIERNSSDAQSIVLLASHCIPPSQVLGISRTSNGDSKRGFVVTACLTSFDTIVKDSLYDAVLAELALRPTVLYAIEIPHQEGFTDIPQLFISQDCVFTDNPKTVINAEQKVLDDGSIVHIFPLSRIPKNTESFTVVGIGAVVSLKVTFDLGLSYADF